MRGCAVRVCLLCRCYMVLPDGCCSGPQLLAVPGYRHGPDLKLPFPLCYYTQPPVARRCRPSSTSRTACACPTSGTPSLVAVTGDGCGWGREAWSCAWHASCTAAERPERLPREEHKRKQLLLTIAAPGRRRPLLLPPPGSLGGLRVET